MGIDAEFQAAYAGMNRKLWIARDHKVMIDLLKNMNFGVKKYLPRRGVMKTWFLTKVLDQLLLQEPEGIGVGGQIKTQLKADAMVIFAGPESRKSHR